MNTSRPSRWIVALTSALRFITILIGLSLLLAVMWLPFDALGASVPEWTYWVFVFPLQVVAAIVLTRRAQWHRGSSVASEAPESNAVADRDDQSASAADDAAPGGGTSDAGWRKAVPIAVPTLGWFVSRGDLDALTGLRAVYLSFLSALGLIGLVVAILAPDIDGTMSPWPVAVGVVGLGGALLVGGAKIERPLDCSSDTALLGSYRTRFLLRVAFAEIGALLGFVGFILSGNGWIYPVGLAVSVVGFVRLAPTTTHLNADQRLLTSSGCTRDLVGLLQTTRPKPHR